MILLLHNEYRVRGGEERAVEDLQWLIASELDEPVEVLRRRSANMSGRGAARALLRGGVGEEAVAEAVRRTGARVLHAHNIHPSFGWRALAAARGAGARTVLHLHNYRLVCANGVCFTRGEDCTRCTARNTLPGVVHDCRAGGRAEAAVYAAALARWQPAVAEHVDRFVVPSAFALQRLRELRAPVQDATVIPSVQRAFAERSRPGSRHVLFAGRVAPEKGVFDAIDACAAAGLKLVVAGEGPALEAVRARGVEAPGRVDGEALALLRAQAGAAIVPSRYEEILPLAALEAMAAGLPVVATRSGGLAEIVPEEGLAPIGDPGELAGRLRALFNDAGAGERALTAARERCAPATVAAQLRAVYAA